MARTQSVWSPLYVDALVERDRDADGNAGTGAGGREERLYALQDANWNTTALVNTSGAVVERYAYDPFGQQTVYDSGYTVRSGGSSYGWVVGFQGLRLSAASGLLEADHRWYSPSLGRWVSNDPIGFLGGDVNLFRFVRNQPVSLVDPSGLFAPPAVLAPVAPVIATPPGAVVAGVAGVVVIGGGSIAVLVSPTAADTVAGWLGWVEGGNEVARAQARLAAAKAAAVAAAEAAKGGGRGGPGGPKAPDDCPPPKCKPCSPPVGSIAYRVDMPPSDAHNGIPTPHSHKYEMMQSPPHAGCKCFWKEVLKDPLPGIWNPPITPAQGGGIMP